MSNFYKHSLNFAVLAHVFDIPTPKDDIDGSMVREVYYTENNLKRIVTYCEKDVVTLMQLMLRYKGEQLLKDEEIDFV